MKVYGTSAKCPKCGKQLYVRNVGKGAFVCKECDTEFCKKELESCLADFWEINIPVMLKVFEENLSSLQQITDRYKCDFLGYDPGAELMDIGWEKEFPEDSVLKQLIEEIEALLTR